MLSSILASAALCPQGPGTSTSPVVINEFVYDDAGTDDYEFCELYNRSSSPVDISLWQIRSNDPSSPPLGNGGVPTHTIPAGTVLAPGAFYLVGSANLVPTPVPGVSQQWANNALENGNSDTCELTDALGNMMDEITYELDGAVGTPFTLPLPAPNTGSYTYPGEYGISADLAVGNGPTASHARLIDGWDNDNNSTDFGFVHKPSPGASNHLPSVVPFLDTFDTGTPTTAIGGWTGGWVLPKYVDPTVVDSQNPNVRPPSPAGGLAMSTWDSSGGGNTVTLDTAPMDDVVLETYVYLEPMMTPVDPTPYPVTVPTLDTYNMADGESWSLGVRGTTTPNGNPPDLGTYWADVQPGVGTRYHSLTGICWAHVRTPYYSKLYLLDCHQGPMVGALQNHTVIASIDIQPGVNDGWQRLRIHAQGDTVVANFGGTYGSDDGDRYAFTTSTMQLGQVYIAYREAILFNANGLAGCHPPHFDLLGVHQPTTGKSFFGTGSPSSVGVPTLGTDGLPILGSTGFAITASGLVPQGAPGYTFCGLAMGFTPFPTGFPIPGAPNSAMGYVLSVAGSVLNFADASGDASWPFPLPPNNSLVGVQVSFQVADYDASMPFSVPIGLTNAMQVTIGN